MLLQDIAIPGGAYGATCAGIWYVCKRTDSLLSKEGKEKIASWLREPINLESIFSSTIAFRTLFTVFLGKRVYSFGFIFRSVLISLIWFLVLFAIFYENIPKPFSFRIASQQSLRDHNYTTSAWYSFMGNLVFDENFEYIMPVITPVFTFIFCNFLGDYVTLLLIHKIYSRILASRRSRLFFIVTPLSAVAVGTIVSYVFVTFAYFMSILVVGKLSMFPVSEYFSGPIEYFHNALDFPSGHPPYVMFESIPVLSTALTISWCLLFVLSTVLIKVISFFLRVEKILARFLDVQRKPFEATGWMMILLFSPLFWFAFVWKQ